ncbi:hypothetical protein niasHT_013981 [Heterodera trifolii]|uniref:Uncharacterized protein n=1 Tax=Heterodera trifolii TaxID=157864 RepID=A0ABD2KLR9_9BILA
MDTDSVLQPVFIFAFAAVELLINLICVPVSAINFFLVAKSSVIHPNLKHILIYQSGCILGRGMCRFTTCLLKFVQLSPLASESFQSIGTIYSFFIFERNTMAHVLIIERVLATVTAKSYERRRKPFFTLGWLITVISLGLFNAIGYRENGLSIVLTNYALLFSAGIELCVFSLLRWHSEKAYFRTLHSSNGHNLSERYQLVPTLVFHLFNIMSSTLITNWSLFTLPGYDYMLVFCSMLSSFCSLMIEISIIMCHPFLKREFTHIMNRFGIGSSSRSIRVAVAENGMINGLNNGGGQKIATTNILNGEALVIEQKQEAHFEMLRKLWK